MKPWLKSLLLVLALIAAFLAGAVLSPVPARDALAFTRSEGGQQLVVYISRNHVIHSRPDCSGMKRYAEVDAEVAVKTGYRMCSKCW